MADLLSISASAVGVYQRVLGVVSNNIANVGTEGYVKQEAAVGQTSPTFDGRSFLGTGAVFDGVQRQFNAFVEGSLRTATSGLHSQQVLQDYAARVLDVVGHGQIGLSPALDQFYASASSLTAQPASTAARTAVLRSTEGVAQRFADLSGQLLQLDQETRQALETQVQQVNAVAQQLATVNQALGRTARLDRQPATLLDQRDALLRSLSEMVDAQVELSPQGTVKVLLGGAGSAGILVDGSTARSLQVAFNASQPEQVHFTLDPYGDQPQALGGVQGGRIGGLSAFRSQTLAPVWSQLDTVATTFLQSVNRIQAEGVDGYGQPGQDLLALRPQFAVEPLRLQGGLQSLQVQARVADPSTFTGAPVDLTFDAQAGQVVALGLTGPFAAGDRMQVSLNGQSRILTLGGDVSVPGVASQLQQFVDGAFGIQLRTEVDPDHRLLITSPVMPSFRLDVQVASAQGRVQNDLSQGLWVATDTAGRRITGTHSLTVDGVTVAIQALGASAPADGDRLRIQADRRPAAGLVALQEDPLRIAAARAFRVVAAAQNTGRTAAAITAVPGGDSPSAAAPVLGMPGGLPNTAVVSQASVWTAQRVVPLAQIAAGQSDVTLYLDPGTTPANLQILTRDGRHLLGSDQADGAAFVAQINSLPAPFEPGSHYSADLLGAQGDAAYRGLDLFYGVRAQPRVVPVWGTDHVPIGTQTLDAELRTDLPVATGSQGWAADTFTVNGVSLPARQGVASGASDWVNWLNGALDDARAAAQTDQRWDDLQALDGIRVQRDGEGWVMTRPSAAGLPGQTGSIQLGFGAHGTPADLARMGLRTTASLRGTAPEDLLVFTSGTGDVRVAAEFSGSPWTPAERREAQRHSPFDVEFLAQDRVRITDVATGTVLAERQRPAGSALTFHGVQITWNGAPQPGDHFRVDGNAESLGDGGNAQRWVALEREGVLGPQQGWSLGESYLQLVDTVAQVQQQSAVAVQALEVVQAQAQSTREEASGVSLDEEAAKLIRYQQAYQAAAKALQTASQLFDAVLRI